jgi:hypothetical protein
MIANHNQSSLKSLVNFSLPQSYATATPAGVPLQSMAAKTLVDVQGGLKFAKSPQWIEQKLTFLDIHDRCIKSTDMDGNVQTIGALPHLPDSLRALAARPCLYDTVVDSHGGMYVVDIGFDFLDPLVDPVPNGMIIYVSADGESSVAAEELYFPGGLIIPLDNKTLVVAESLRHRLTAFAIGAAGALGNRRVWAQFDDDINPEGICLDRDGAIWIAGAGRRALLVKEGGAIERQVTTERPVFATALGGPDQNYLFLCTSDSNDPVITRQIAGATIDFAVVCG